MRGEKNHLVRKRKTVERKRDPRGEVSGKESLQRKRRIEEGDYNLL